MMVTVAWLNYMNVLNHSCQVGLLVPTRDNNTQDNNDCESESDTDVRCNADALISHTAQDLAASAHIDLSNDDVVILDDSDSDNNKCDDSLVVTDVDFTESAVPCQAGEI